jgi:hypothetical protein
VQDPFGYKGKLEGVPNRQGFRDIIKYIVRASNGFVALDDFFRKQPELLNREKQEESSDGERQ